MALLTNSNDSRAVFQLYPLLEYLFPSNRRESWTELLSSSQTMLHLRFKSIEETHDRVFLQLHLVSRHRAAFLWAPFHLVAFLRLSAPKIFPAIIAENEFGGVILGPIAVTPKAIPGAQFRVGA